MKRALPMLAVLAAAWTATGICVAGSRPAGSNGAAEDAAKRIVEGVLSVERDGGVTDRTKRLRGAVRHSPQFAPAQWQSGRVQFDGEWLSVPQSVARLAGDKTLRDYRQQRAKSPRTLAGQLELAAWCRKNKLFAQQRAHLTAALEFDPNHASARKALGFVRVGPFWMSQRELQQRRKEAEQAAKDLKHWSPKIKSIRDALTGGSRLRYHQGLKRLKSIDDPAAIPAIELALAYDNAQLALVAIDYLGEKTSKESTLALARQGMFSPWKTLRKRAAQKLKGRRLEDFVPNVLAVMATPVESRRFLYLDLNGSLFYRNIYVQEHRDARHISVADHRHTSILNLVPLYYSTGDGSDAIFRPIDRAAATYPARSGALDSARELASRHQGAQDELNEMQSEVTSRVARLLSSVSGKAFASDARQLWDWWDRHTEVWHVGEKPYYVDYAKSETAHVFAGVEFVKCSCLAAGTPVWTDRGPLAIDKVQIGDRVLSQNVDTGELAYKPVLKTTVRPKRPLIALEIGPRTVRMTSGHPFWVAGKGWVKSRDVKVGMAMHDVTGTTAVRPVGTTKAEPTYNLIVADFHTYFVGESKVLSHDNTPIEPTNVLVPGLQRSR